MKNQRILIGLAWVITIVIAYFAGGTGTPAQPAASAGSGTSQSGGSNSGSSTGNEARTVVRKLDGT